MLIALLTRVASAELAPLARRLAARLAERGEDLTVDRVEAYLRELAGADAPHATFLGREAHRVAALACALDDLAASTPPPAVAAAVAAPTPPSPATAPPRAASAVSPEPDAPAVLTEPELRARVRRLVNVTVGPPRIERALLDGAGRQSFVWREGDDVHAVGPATNAIVAACAPHLVTLPDWQVAWPELTAPGRNPWQVPTADALPPTVAAALRRTTGATPRDPYRASDPRAAFVRALAEANQREQARLAALLTPTTAGQVQRVTDDRARTELTALAGRAASLATTALVPLVLADLASGPLVELTPARPGLALDVIGRAAGGYVRVRAIRLHGQPHRFVPVALPSTPRGAVIVDGGDVLVAMFGP